MIGKHKLLKMSEKTANKILMLHDSYAKLSNAQLKAKTKEFKKRFASGEELDDMLVEAFATVREAIYRIEHIYLYKVQLMGGFILHHGEIAEMKTGEGKTLTATLPAYLNAIAGKGVLVVTVNDYLAKRDKQETEKIYHFLDLSTGLIEKDQLKEAKKKAYDSDITYTTNSEFGFDYLKDNMVRKSSDKTQRGFAFGIVDEADSILIDEARTPLIISGGKDKNTESYTKAQDFVKKLKENEYDIDEETRVVTLTDQGIKAAEKYFKIKNLYNYEHAEMVHRIQNALYANYILKKNIQYAISEGKIELIDQFTGRILKGRSYSNGVHQAVEAKEKLEINPESKIIATITYQNLFRMFSKLCGMTGTALTEEEEFVQIYNLRVFQIPTNKPLIRRDEADEIYSRTKGKWEAVVEEIRKRHLIKQPVLVGTASVEDSEKLSALLKKAQLHHEVLNAKNHTREAEIVAKAGKLASITISTNMAGRGTDIKISDEVKLIGGLCVIGTNRHDSRRIDNQLRGRSGRQGDPGITKFIISLDDEIMIRSGANRMQNMMDRLGNRPLKSKIVTKSITNAQKKIEGQNFDQRKNVVEYDNVSNQHRQAIYNQRDLFLLSDKTEAIIKQMFGEVVDDLLGMDYFLHKGKLNTTLLINSANQHLLKGALALNAFDKKDIEEVRAILVRELIQRFDRVQDKMDPERFLEYCQNVLLINLDNYWQNHLETLTRLRVGIQYRGYAQTSPLQSFIREANELYQKFKSNVIHASIRTILNSQTEVRKPIGVGVKPKTVVKAPVAKTVVSAPAKKNVVSIKDKKDKPTNVRT